MQKTAILILAAGGSTRMGKPKLAEKYKNSSLLERVIAAVTGFRKPHKLIVFGGYKETYFSQIEGSGIELVVNDKWNEGISSSIKIGIEQINRRWKNEIDSVMILLADMALVNFKYLDAMSKAASESIKGIIASNYGPSIGPPVIFSSKYFQELMNLKGDRGAKSVIFNHSEDLETLEFPDGLIDIDTPEDLRQLNRRQ